ncbi:MAG: NAD-dependent epimerase/dehydratase [Candidatus Peregrinibacteria bacterium Greene0416_19]|nr:MAG: NAD-dependent epimerase/dehydratase [Candidatus Peregrinibacteria bacterium Greene0416_19]
MPAAIVTGGSGFFGGILKRALLAKGWTVVSVDLVRDDDRHEHLTAIQGDIRDRALLDRLFTEHQFDAVFHCAAILAHAVKDKKFLWSCNVDGTRALAEAMRRYDVWKIVFISSNCLWGEGMKRPVREDDQPNPVEIYGKSKWEAEKILETAEGIDPVIIRCPTIIDEGRLGLLAILFEFIDEGRKVWVVGGGKNRYQFIYAKDLVDACVRAAEKPVRGIFNIGSDDVKSFREVYQEVITRAGTGARVASLPRAPTLAAMKIAYALGLSPLGPYQYKMIAEDFTFDTSKMKRELGWTPTLTNEEMLWKAYNYYHEHRKELAQTESLSAHRQPAKMGIIKLLKWMS